MKRMLQIAAGILLASAVIFSGRLLLAEAASKQAQRAQAEARKVQAAEEERRNLESGCYVITSDGRKFACPTP